MEDWNKVSSIDEVVLKKSKHVNYKIHQDFLKYKENKGA